MVEFNPLDLIGKLPALPQLQSPFGSGPPVHLLRTPTDAESMHGRLIQSIIDFEKELDSEHELGARLVSFSEREPIHIDDVGFWGKDLIVFHGRNLDGHPVRLLQHVTQVSVLLVAVAKTGAEPRRIGFKLEKRLESSDGGT